MPLTSGGQNRSAGSGRTGRSHVEILVQCLALCSPLGQGDLRRTEQFLPLTWLRYDRENVRPARRGLSGWVSFFTAYPILKRPDG